MFRLYRLIYKYFSLLFKPMTNPNQALQAQIDAIAKVALQQAQATQQHLEDAGLQAVDAVIAASQQQAQQNALQTVAAYAQQRLQGAANIVSDDVNAVQLPAAQGVQVVDVTVGQLGALPPAPTPLNARPELPNRLAPSEGKTSSQKRRERRLKATQSTDTIN